MCVTVKITLVKICPLKNIPIRLNEYLNTNRPSGFCSFNSSFLFSDPMKVYWERITKKNSCAFEFWTDAIPMILNEDIKKISLTLNMIEIFINTFWLSSLVLLLSSIHRLLYTVHGLFLCKCYSFMDSIVNSNVYIIV